VLSLWLLFIEAPEHSRLRKLMNKGFSRVVVDGVRPQIEAFVDRMLANKTIEVDFFRRALQRVRARHRQRCAQL
jgi:cytochrome P450